MEIRQKVVCIDDSVKVGQEEFVAKAYKQWVKKDQVYTVRAVLDNNDIVTGILLKEVKNNPIYIHLIDDFQEPAFRLSRFRELNEFEPVSKEEEVVNIIKQILEL
jgi:hypothetical protein